MKIKHTVIAITLATMSLSTYAEVLEFRAGKARPDYAQWINANTPPHVKSKNAVELLKQPPFAPKDVNLFMPAVYASASPTMPARPPHKPVTVKQLKERVGAIAGYAGLKVMNDPALIAKIPDPRLRAALATLPGTALEGSINAIKSGTFSSVEFGTPPSNPNANAEVRIDNATGKATIIMNQNYQN